MVAASVHQNGLQIKHLNLPHLDEVFKIPIISIAYFDSVDLAYALLTPPLREKHRLAIAEPRCVARVPIPLGVLVRELPAPLEAGLHGGIKARENAIARRFLRVHFLSTLRSLT